MKEEQQLNAGNTYLNCLVNLGICYKNMNLFEEAMNYYKKARDIAPEDEGVLFNYGISLIYSI